MFWNFFGEIHRVNPEILGYPRITGYPLMPPPLPSGHAGANVGPE